ncbi:MAG: CsgG/HfaB family protein [Elusimicrobiota bacterium]
MLITELARTGRLVLVERERLDKVFDEQKLAAAGFVEADTAAEMGRLLGLNAVVLGTISNFGAATKGSDYIIGRRKNLSASATVDVRVVDAETAEVVYADSGRGEASSSTGEVLGMGSRQEYDEALEGDALRAAISQLAKNISRRIDLQRWSCRVADLEGGRVLLDAGKTSGLRRDQKLAVYRLGREVKSPATGKVIGRTREKIGELRIVDFFGADGSVATFTGKELPKRGDVVLLPE